MEIDSRFALSFGEEAQKRIAGFSRNALENVKTGELEKAGDELEKVLEKISGKSFLKRAFSRKNTLETLDNVAEMLETRKIGLVRDIAVLDEMLAENERNLCELDALISEGERLLSQSESEVLEKKLIDLRLTRAVSVQLVPQIKLIQRNDALMAEKLETAISCTLPLLQSRLLIALENERTQKAIKAHRAVSDLTNKLLCENAASIKQASIDAQTEAERSIVSIDAVRESEKILRETVSELVRIKNEAKAARINMQNELLSLESDMKLVSLRDE